MCPLAGAVGESMGVHGSPSKTHRTVKATWSRDQGRPLLSHRSYRAPGRIAHQQITRGNFNNSNMLQLKLFMLSMFIRFIDLGYLVFFLILVRFVSARRQAPALEVDLCRWEDFNFSKAFHSRFNLATLAMPWPFLNHSLAIP